MTPIPLILPLKADEAAALADLVYEQVEGKRLTDDVRNRIAARVPSLELKTFVAFPGSLQEDPIHPSTYYIAGDTRGAGPSQPLLLRIALDSSPASGLFPGALLIGRMRTAGGYEIVLNAVPFAAADHDHIDTFAGKVDRAFLPRPQGAQSAISVSTGDPEAAFRDFRSILKAGGVNLASLECPYHAGVWAAIRAGWREGYGLGTSRLADAQYTLFTIEASSSNLGAAAEQHHHIARLKAGQDSWKRFDFELSLAGGRTPTTADALRLCLGELKARGCLPQMVEPNLSGESRRLAELVDVARHFNVTLSIRHRGGEQEAELREIGRITGGRFHYKCSPGTRAPLADAAVSGSDAEGSGVDLRWIACCLLGITIPA